MQEEVGLVKKGIKSGRRGSLWHARLGFGIAALLGLGGCAAALSTFVPSPTAQPHPESQNLVAQFWTVFQNGDYDAIESVETPLKAAYLERPDDPELASKIGFLHAWRATERIRQADVQPQITDDLTLAMRYFEAAYNLDPDNPVTHGFYRAFALADATIHHNPKKVLRAGMKSRTAVRAWPEFNLFTFAYLTHALPFDPERNAEALGDLEKIISICTQASSEDAPKQQAEAFDAVSQSENEEYRRACGNTSKVPFNIQGFLLNLGDTYLRQGDQAKAERAYQTLTHTVDYPQWPFQSVVAHRLENLAASIPLFQTNPPFDADGIAPTHRAMFHSSMACVGCHQKGTLP